MTSFKAFGYHFIKFIEGHFNLLKSNKLFPPDLSEVRLSQVSSLLSTARPASFSPLYELDPASL